MTQLFTQHRSATAPARRARHRCNLEVGLLEGRTLLSGAGSAPVPASAAFVSGAQGWNGYYSSPVNVALVASEVDDSSNTLSTYYSINGRPFVEGNSLTLTNNGGYVVSYYSTDSAGDVGFTHMQIILIDRTAPVVTEFVSPTTLWPPNHKYVPVTVEGHVADSLSGIVPVVHYFVGDEYGQDQPQGYEQVDAQGNYSFVVYLQASRLGQDSDGRQYAIDVFAVDRAGNVGFADGFVTVPHDMGRHSGQGSQDGGGEDGSGQGSTQPIVVIGGSDGSSTGKHGNGHGNNGHHKRG